MSLEIGSFIADLTPANPVSNDPVGQGDDHLRLIKTCVQATLPNMGSIFGQVRSIDVATSLSSTWNTNLIVVSSSATATVVLTLPPGASITTGFILNFFTLGGAAISLVPSGAASINGNASLPIPERNYAFAQYQGANVWRGGTIPNGTDGTSVFGTSVTIAGSLSVSGAATLNALSVSGGTVLNGPATLNTTLSVSGIATFKSAISVSGVSILNGAVSMNGSLSVSANATFNSGMSVSGAAIFKTTMSIGGAVQMASTLLVGGAATFDSSVSISGVFTANGAAQFNGAITGIDTMSISGAAVFGATVQVRGGITAESTLSVSGGFHAKTTMSVGGATTLAGAVTAASTMSISGATHLKTTLSVGGATTLAGALTVAGTVTISGTLILSNGQIKFPATQNASSDVNVLDDYEEGTWTPTVTFATPGTLSLTYSTQKGLYTKVGNMVNISMQISCATFVPGTASGNFLIQGIPFATTSAQGITSGGSIIGGPGLDAGFTQTGIQTATAGSASLLTMQTGSDKTPSTMTATQWDGAIASPNIYATLTYFV